jgi:polysaccharide export outer membrane protein
VLTPFTMALLFACARQSVELSHLPTEETAISSDYLIGSEDVVEVMVWKNPDLSRQVTVRPDGKISLPLIGDVQAAGYTVPQLREQITEKLKVYYQESPQVSVIVQQVNGYAIYILGEVRNPGKYVVRTGTTFLQALSLAQGFTDFASSNKIVVRRQMAGGEEATMSIRYKDVVLGRQKNIVLKPGDTIVVP